jgi:hypothetical protein
MALKPGNGTAPFPGDRCLAAKIVLGGPPNPPCGAKAVQPTPAPVAKTEVKKITITCTKGKVVKKVSGTTPKCPVGYKKK